MSQGIREEEERFLILISEALAVFEGGECREDFEFPMILLRIEDIVDMLYRFRKEIEGRQEGRRMMDELYAVMNQPYEKEGEK